MRTWLGGHRSAFVLACRRLAAAPVNSLLSALAIGVTLALPAGGEMLLTNVAAVVAQLPAPARISVFMATPPDQRASTELEGRLRQHAAIKSVRFIGHQETLARMRGREDLADVLAILPANPFPDAFIIEPRNEGAQAIEALAGDLRRMRAIEHVQLDSGWVRRLDAAMRLARMLVLALSVLLAIGLVAITFNTIRLQVLGGRNEIEVCRLLGATDIYVARPFRYFGLLQALAGGSIALLLATAAGWWLRAPAADLASAYGLVVELQPLSLTEATSLLAASAALGWLGAALSVRQHLRAG
jgi:cell division transport system permease protein